MSVVRRIESIVPRKAAAFGGKAKNLAALARAGFPVPAAYALEASAADEFFKVALPRDERPTELLAAPMSTLSAERLDALRERARQAPIPKKIAQGLEEAFDALRAEGALAVAVRSSSTREDQEAASAAGLHRTELGVSSREALLEAVRECWLSILTPGAMTYLRALSNRTEGVGIGIVVQAMVPSEVAGAMFTVNPLTGETGELIVNAAYGLGSAVMDGKVSPDTFRVDKTTRWVRDRVIGDKAIALSWSPSGGVVSEDVDPERRARACLPDDLLDALVRWGIKVEEQWGDARDIEWAIVGRTIFLLQARPVTALARPPRRRGGRKAPSRERSRIVWSNANVGEALPGVATPLTWSILSEFSERGFRRAFGALGCRVPKDAELVGSFRGRIYLNMTEFVEIASQVPGIRPRMLLSLGGGGEVDRLEREAPGVSSKGFLMRLPVTVTRYVRENAGLSARVESFEESFAAEYGRLTAIDFRVLSDSGLDRVLFRVERLLDDSGLVMLNVYGNLLATVLLLRGVLAVVSQKDAQRLERDLLSGLADVDSAAPSISIWHIAETARAEPAARALLTTRDPREIRLDDLPDGPTRRALARFLTAYGYRGAREAEIAEARWSEDPSLILATIRAHLLRPKVAEAPSPAALERRQQQMRDAAQKELERRLFGPIRVSVRHLLSLVQRFTRLRERLRANVVQVLGLYRRVALDASRRLAVREPGAGDDAAFMLSIEELHAFLRGDATTLVPIVRRRRLQLSRDRALPEPPDTFVGFPPVVPETPPPSDALIGLPAMSGRVRGSARVLLDPRDAAELRAGEVLIAPYADVGWSPLFLVASAIVTDLGGPLSHAAVVARELGVPTVVNVKDGTRRVHTGDEVEVDGTTGTVRILSRATDA
ncbi:MAG: PEP/pyruvate-binding domain-containing protein [Sandaracinaceae bacterium]